VINQGQFLERPAIIAVGDCVLDGLWHRGADRPPLLIIPPPPNQGSMHHPVVAELAWAAATSGFPTLRFDFRGVGASQGAPGGSAERLTDAEAALRLLEENTGVALAAVASFGASAETLLALHGLHRSIAGLCFVSPAGLSTSELALLPVPVIAIIGGRDGSIAQAPLAAAISEARGQLEIIPASDCNFDRNLPEVGKALVRWLLQLRAP